MTKLSVIVPVYNVEKYLPRCVESLLSQTLEDIEILLVDDGSTDGSGKICDAFALRDSRVRVLHFENRGVSAARNEGISAANGEYLGFVDADDYVSPDMFRTMYDTAKEHLCQTVICDVFTDYGGNAVADDTISSLSESCVLQKEEIPSNVLVEIAGSACRSIYSRQLFDNPEIRFPVGLKLSEDRVFNLYALGYSDRIYYLKKPFYYHFVRDGSAVNRYHDDYLSTVLFARGEILRAVEKVWGGGEDYRKAYEEQTVDAFYAAVGNEFLRGSKKSFSEKLEALRGICECPELRNAIEVLNRNDIRAKLIIKKSVLPLAFFAKAANIKNGR